MRFWRRARGQSRLEIENCFRSLAGGEPERERAKGKRTIERERILSAKERVKYPGKEENDIPRGGARSRKKG